MIDSLTRLYDRLIKGASNLQSLFLLWIRLTWGPQFFLLGAQKLNNPATTADFFASVGFSHPLFHVYWIGYVEWIGGILLILGLASRLAAIPLLATTLTLLKMAHGSAISEWKFLTHPSLISSLPPYPLFITALLILIFGPGKLSLDGWIKRWIHKKNS